MSIWRKIIIPMYRLWLHSLYGLYGPRCPLSPKKADKLSLSLNQDGALIEKSCWKIQFVVLSDGIAYGPYWPSSASSPKTYIYLFLFLFESKVMMFSLYHYQFSEKLFTIKSDISNNCEGFDWQQRILVLRKNYLLEIHKVTYASTCYLLIFFQWKIVPLARAETSRSWNIFVFLTAAVTVIQLDVSVQFLFRCSISCLNFQ